MKLRNKKTGDVIEDKCLNYALDDMKQYYSLAELNEEWEDYKPKEPLIKDETTLKLVRAWADYNSIEKVRYSTALKSCDLLCIGGYDFMIELIGLIPTLQNDEIYTITELCGEEEE